MPRANAIGGVDHARASHRYRLASRSTLAHAQGRCNGIDGQTAEEYAAKLEDNLRSLLDRAKFGDAYRASPVRHHDVITLTVQRMHA